MGKNIEGEEDIVKRMSEEGHLIGNHSYEHIQLTKAGAKAVCEAVEHTQEQIEAITGKRPEYIRPPYGDWNEELEEEIGMTPVLWSLDSPGLEAERYRKDHSSGLERCKRWGYYIIT